VTHLTSSTSHSMESTHSINTELVPRFASWATILKTDQGTIAQYLVTRIVDSPTYCRRVHILPYIPIHQVGLSHLIVLSLCTFTQVAFTPYMCRVEIASSMREYQTRLNNVKQTNRDVIAQWQSGYIPRLGLQFSGESE
jgi:hypothetical protein